MGMKKFAAAVMSAMMLFANANINPVLAADKPEVRALGAVLMDYRTGRVLWGKNEHAPMAMASTTKIMTAIMAIESGQLDKTVEVSKRVSLTPPCKMGLSVGEHVKISDLLYALMLESQNDAAMAIAEGIGGTVEQFCSAMTQKAKELGAEDTLFVTPNGLDKGDHHSTAYDMALIARYAMANQDFVKLINTESKTFSSDRRSYTFNNKNRLLHEYEGANGIKTGFTGKAGQCFVGAARRGNMELISVVLASGWGPVGKAAKWSDTKAILNYGFKNFSYHDIIKAGDEAGTVTVGRSRTPQVNFVYGADLVLPVTADELNNIKVANHLPEQLLAPVTNGQVLGEADVVLNGEVEATIPLVAIGEAERHDFKTSLEKMLTAWFTLASDSDVRVVLPESSLWPVGAAY
jgi:D-alanyl-D-alanine carboxypeptidase (penicillin-binding protein 5/6)